MFNIFRVPWAELGLDDVEAFLADAGEEGVTWEAKADDEDRSRPPGDTPGCLRKNTIRKAGCGLANQIGGYLLVGARWDKTAHEWHLPGVLMGHPEPELWIGQLLRELRPAPRTETRAWSLSGGRTVAVTRIEPVDEPPCMTPQGHVYQRVSGETQRIKDPTLLSALFDRGRDAQQRASELAHRAAERAFDTPRWVLERSVSVTVALAPIGRETDNIRPRLFVPSFIEAMSVELERMLFEEATGRERWQQQDAYTVLAHNSQRMAYELAEDRLEHRTWLIQATWDGAIAASVVLNAAAAYGLSGFDQAVRPAWEAVDPLVQALGGYGPAELVVHTFAAPQRRHITTSAPPPAPSGTLYSRLPEHTFVQRRVNLGEIDEDTLGSVQRETIRASGRESFEPEPSG